MNRRSQAGRRRLAPGDVAAWLLKTSVHPAEIQPGWLPHQERTLERCVARSYRLSLIRPGQMCVLWLSGRLAPGVHALGHVVQGPLLTEAPDVQPAVDAQPAVDGRPAVDGQPAVTVSLRLLAEPVPRANLIAHPAFAKAEVATMPAGSNPSYLTDAQLAAVLALAGEPAARRSTV